MAYRRFKYPYPKPDGTIGYRRRRRKKYPQWYKIDHLQEGELLGSIQKQYNRCGKPNCKCASGDPEALHGPYYYRVWRDERGRQRKAYVKRSNLDEVQAAIDRRARRLSRERAKRNEHMRRGMGAGLPAHEWACLNGGSGSDRGGSDLMSSMLELSRLVDELMKVR